MLPVADMNAVVTKLLNRLEANGAPPSITVAFGWDGARIMANMGDYNKLVRSLPMERVTIERGDTIEQASTAIRVAVARLQVSLRDKAGRGVKRSPKRKHPFRSAARQESIARGQSGD